MKKTHLWICSKVTDICMKSYWPDKFHSRQGRQGLKMLGTYTWPSEQFMFMHKCVVLPWTCPTVSGFRFKMPPHASAEFICNAVQDSLNLQSIHLWVLHMCFQGRIDMLLLIWCCYSCLLSRFGPTYLQSSLFVWNKTEAGDFGTVPIQCRQPSLEVFKFAKAS